MGDTMTGGCACGKVRFEADVEDDEAYLCHCRMCQRTTGSISIAFKNMAQARMRWLSEPDWYESSAIARRPYCRECGTSLGFQFSGDSDKLDLTVAAFDDPSRFKPKHHFGAESMHRAWLNTDGLPEIRTEDYPKLVDKWVEATGSFPG